MSKVTLALFGLALAGCVADPDVSEVTQEAAKSPGNCEVYGCGSNSPEVEGKLFWTLHEGGQENDEHIYIKEFKKGTQVLKPDVVDGQLLARHPVTGAILYSGLDVVNAVFTLYDSELKRFYYVTIFAAERMNMWATRPRIGGTWSYQLLYMSSVTGTQENLCNAAGGSTPGQNPFSAVLFDDDRISTEKLIVYAETRGWFTIGCAGSALAKLHLTGNTKPGLALIGKSTTLADRTAFLKMITGDYCGKGQAWTRALMPLHYRDVKGDYSTTVNNEYIEGLWTKDGAVCVGTPRLEAHPTPLFGLSIADEMADPETFCTLPPACTPAQYDALYNFNGAYAMSTNY